MKVQQRQDQKLQDPSGPSPDVEQPQSDSLQDPLEAASNLVEQVAESTRFDGSEVDGLPGYSGLEPDVLQRDEPDDDPEDPSVPPPEDPSGAPDPEPAARRARPQGLPPLDP